MKPCDSRKSVSVTVNAASHNSSSLVISRESKDDQAASSLQRPATTVGTEQLGPLGWQRRRHPQCCHRTVQPTKHFLSHESTAFLESSITQCGGREGVREGKQLGNGKGGATELPCNICCALQFSRSYSNRPCFPLSLPFLVRFHHARSSWALAGQQIAGRPLTQGYRVVLLGSVRLGAWPCSWTALRKQWFKCSTCASS